MKKKHLSFVAIAALLIASACDGNRSASTTDTDSTATADHSMGHDSAGVQHAGTMGTPMEKGGLKVYSYSNSVDFPDADLDLNQPEKNGKVAGDSVQFEYEVKNYQLSQQTPDAATHEHANSKEGQHIHNIVDNEPYTAHYKPSFKKAIEPGQHVVLSFLSRSYHESIKHKDAYDLRVITVGNGGKSNLKFDEGGQHLFYSRPKGEYKGADTKKVMLDFYLVNTSLDKGGNKVRATINGNEFILDQWLPYLVEGLPMGENTFKLELINSQGQVIPGPFNTVERKITLKQ
ncbi:MULTISPECIES: hypothetical protein [Rufibacter]|uniref:Phosphopeptide-binding protein n=1 Tax=Rufibacter quisquiliarum TaxID=1549639 RepID=A0A839GUT3_9BACT|nr:MULTISPECIES: hypothetical protein [Rufibacter]MBA9078526.1 hypothetical protein [Rufibacter quisquiliarum]